MRIILSVLCIALLGACSGLESKPDSQESQAYENNQFDRLEDLADFSTAVVVGQVVDLQKNREDFVESEQLNSTVLTVVVDVERVLRGSIADDRVSFEFQGPDVAPGTPVEDYPERRLNGVPTPTKGDRLLLFLHSIDPHESPGDFPATHGLVNLDGIYRVVDGGVLRTDVIGEGRIANELDGMTVDSLTSLLGGVAPWRLSHRTPKRRARRN